MTLREKLFREGAPRTENVEECPICRSRGSAFLFDGFDRLHHIPGKFALVRCGDCGLLRLSPRPEVSEIGRYYPESDYYSYISDAGSIHGVAAEGFSARLRASVLGTLGYPVDGVRELPRLAGEVLKHFFLRRATYGWGDRFPVFRPGGAALDIGCGNGRYLSYLKHHGWRVQGVELSQVAADAAKELFDIDVHVGPLESVPFECESFDHISMFHSLEHLYDLKGALSKVHELLKPDGLLYIEVPNARSFGAKLDREFWFHWDMPRHIWGFDPISLTRLVEAVGFKVTRMTTLLAPSHDWAETYRQEEAIGRKLDRRPCVYGFTACVVKAKTLVARVVRLFRRQSGNYICCWLQK